jgi:dihydrofolate synthase / folylpolyglutamate synthase
MLRLVELIGNPQHSYPVIHVAGTNGKGSVCSMLDSIYRANKYKTGLFTSPHLVELGERIRVNGEIISNLKIEEWVECLKSAAQIMEEDPEIGHPTFFEFMTAIAFLHFEQNKVDLAIMETGLGGRLDSTNVVKPELSIITTISKDHCNILGNTLEEIAGEKAGIIKPLTPVLTGWLPDCALGVVEAVASKVDSPLHRADVCPKASLPKTNLMGSYQRRNASLSSLATEILKSKFPVSEELVRSGLQNVKMLGRWQIIESPTKIILDACHNTAGAECLRENLQTLVEKPEVWIGVLGEDRAPEIMKVVCEFASSLKLFEVNQPRACSIKFLQTCIPNLFDGEVTSFTLKNAEEFLSKKHFVKTILVTGSIYLIGDILGIQKKDREFCWNDLF